MRNCITIFIFIHNHGHGHYSQGGQGGEAGRGGLVTVVGMLVGLSDLR